MIARLSLLLAIVAAASAFSFSSSGARSRSALSMSGEKSKALPFLKRPAKLNGAMVGDFGFDPLGLTNTLSSTSYVQAAELKHCRVAMLATVGFVFQQYFHIVSDESNPIKAVGSLGYMPNLQILSLIGLIELATWDKTFSGETPGDLGFDPMGQMKGKSAQQINDLKLKEVKNGRLAMIAIIGMITQNIIFDGKATLSF